VISSRKTRSPSSALRLTHRSNYPEFTEIGEDIFDIEIVEQGVAL
jgi:hypothetical protein